MTIATFEVDVSHADALGFARVSGDWNPLHTDEHYASQTAHRRPVLHGAFSAGLMSRLAGMYLPGTECLLHSMRLHFLAPIVPPAKLVVNGRLVSEREELGRVEATVSDKETGTRYVDGSYEFSRHATTHVTPAGGHAEPPSWQRADAPILVTGATGGLGRAVLARLGARAIGVARRAEPGMLEVPDFEGLQASLEGRRVAGVVHCAWPAPDNERLTDLPRIDPAVEHHLAAPVRQIVGLGQLVAKCSVGNAMLLLIGSTAAMPGRHNYRMPLYSLAKALIPELSRILATELAPSGKRCAAVTFDVIEGGMNQRLSPMARLAHVDRAPSGQLPSLEEAAAHVEWVLDNASFLVSGANVTLTGAAAP